MREFLAEGFAPTFAGELFSRLIEPKDFGVGAKGWRIRGVLILKAHGETGVAKSRLTIIVGNDWMLVPPPVTCHESFIRREQDWHAYDDGGLCYALADDWRGRIDKLLTSTQEDISRALDYTVTWLLAATDSLITRHLLAARYRIEKWPAEWTAYAHGEDGVHEYLREQRERRFRR